jgi:RNA polymerase sigma factor (sigma-70 family)
MLDTHLSAKYNIESTPVLTAEQEAEMVKYIDKLEVDLINELLINKTFAKSILKQLDTMILKTEHKINLSKYVNKYDQLWKLVKSIGVGYAWLTKVVESVIDPKSSIRFAKHRKDSIKPMFDELCKLRTKFIQSNIRLVFYIAIKLRRRCHSFTLEDLIQEGIIGLMKAFEKFDVTKGFRFNTYATWWIKHHMFRGLEDKDQAVRLPVHLTTELQRIIKAEYALFKETGVTPSYEDISHRSKINMKQIQKVIPYKDRGYLSLDAPLHEDHEDSSMLEATSDCDNILAEEALARNECRIDVREALRCLPPMESQILKWRFGLDDDNELVLKEIGGRYDLSRERIRQIEAQALKKLKNISLLREHV